MIPTALLATAITLLLPALGLPALDSGRNDPPPAPPARQDIERAKQALEKLADRHARAKSLRGKFEQQIHTPLAKKPLRSRGTLFFRREPACAVFVIDQPRHSVVRFDDQSYRVHRPAEKKAETFIFGDDDLAGSFVHVFAPSKGDMEKVFSVERTEDLAPTATPKRPQLLRVTLAPKEKKLAAHFTELALTVDPKSGALHGVSYTNAQGDRIVIVIDQLELDAAIDAKRFDLDLPPGTQTRTHRV